MLTLANDKITVKATFHHFRDDEEYANAIENVSKRFNSDPVSLSFSNHDEAFVEIECSDEVMSEVLESLRYNGFNIINSETVDVKPRRTKAMRNLRKAA